MQNRFTGDIGDFGKYGMLRVLCKGQKLGIVWYLVPDESHNADGNKISYLDPKKEQPTKINLKRYASCDPKLYKALRKIVQSRAREVCAIQHANLFTEAISTHFYPSYPKHKDDPLEFLTFEDVSLNKRSGHRKEWSQRVHKATSGCDLVFLDPDNGLEVRSVGPYAWQKKKKGPKYVMLGIHHKCPNECKQFIQREQNLIIYQHKQRMPIEKQVSQQTDELREFLEVRTIHTLAYYPNPDKSDPKPDRFYYIIPSTNPKKNPISHEELQRFCNGKWKGHFKLIT